MGAREFMKRCAAIGLSLTMAVTNTGGINMLVSAAEEEILIVEDTGTPETLPAEGAEQDSSVPEITVEAETVLPQETEAVVETAPPVSEEAETVSAGSEGTEKVTEAVSPADGETESVSETASSVPEEAENGSEGMISLDEETEGTAASEPGTEGNLKETQPVVLEDGLSIDSITVVEEGTELESIQAYSDGASGAEDDSLVLGQIYNTVYVKPGEDVALSVTADPDREDIVYQWFKDGVEIEGGTESSYTAKEILTNATYWCRVTDAEGNWIYVYFYLSVDNGLELIEQSPEAEKKVPYGESVTLSVKARANTGELTYTWTKDGIGIDGAAGASYTTGPIEKYTFYDCTITDQYGGSVVAQFPVFVDSRLEFTGDSYEEITVSYGNTAELRAEVEADSQNLTYEWSSEGGIFADENTASYTTEEIQKNTSYSCRVTDEYGNSIYKSFYVKVDSGLEVQGNEYDDTVTPGGSVELSVTATAASGIDLTYRWLKDGVEIPEAEGSAYTAENITNNTSYECQVTDEYGNLQGAGFWIRIDSGLEIIGSSYTEEEVELGQQAELSVSAKVNYGDLIYTWFDQDWQEIPGANGSVYLTEPITSRTSYYCQVSDEYGNTVSATYDIMIDNGFNIVGSTSVMLTAEYGDPVELSVSARADSGELTYEWYDSWSDSGQKIEEAAGSTYTIPSLTKDCYVRCLVSDKYGNFGEVFFTIDMESLVIDWDRTETSVYVHPDERQAVLTVYASTKSGNPLTYNWSVYDEAEGDYRDLGESQQSLELKEITASGAEYRCKVSDGVEENSVDFRVYIDNLIVQYDSLVYALPGETVTLSVDASAVYGEIIYQWYMENAEYEGELLSGETSNSIEVPYDGGTRYYYCEVKDVYGNERTAYFDIYEVTELTLAYEENNYVRPGEDIELSVTAKTLTLPLTYEWYEVTYDDYIRLEETGPVLRLSNATKDCRYMCVVEDGSGDTRIAWLDVYVDSGLTLEWEGRISAALGEQVTLSVAASSDMAEQEQLTYEWYYQDTDMYGRMRIPGESTNELTVTAEKTRSYYCMVGDSYMKEEADFYLSVDSGFSVAVSDTTRQIRAGESVTLTVNASVDSGELTYKWLKYNGDADVREPLDATGNIITLENLEVTEEITCQVEDDYGNREEITFWIVVTGSGAPDFKDAVDLTIGEAKVASVEKAGRKMYFKIVPEISGRYIFEAQGPEDTFGTLYDSQKRELVNDDESGKGSNFCITYDLEAGQTYYLEAGFYDEDVIGSFYVAMSKEGESVCAHEWEYINVVSPTCTKDGSRTPRCRKCGLTEEPEKYGNATGHTEGAWKITKANTCTAAGERVKACTKCSTVLKRETIAASGHNAGNWTVKKAATCTGAGEQIRTCTKCGAVANRETIAATGHSFTAWSVKSAATVFAAEAQTRRCASCGYTENRTVGGKLKPTIKVSATTIPLKTKQSTTKLKVTGLAAGDSVKSWKSSNTKIVTVNSKGKLTAKNKTGKTTVTITLASGLQKKVTVKVQKAAVSTTKISGLAKKITLAKGKKQTLKPVITPITSLQKVKYTSSNKKIVTVSSKGVITAKKAGTAKITVASGKKKVTVTVVVPKTKTTAIKGVPAALSMKKGKTYTLKAKKSPSKSDETITYKTSNKKVVTVSASGKLTAKKKGKATITVKSGKISVKCKVTVK